MKKLNFIFLFIVAFGFSQNNKILTDDLTTIFELSNGTETPTYFQTIKYFEKLASRFDEIQMIKIGETDSGYPLHLVVYNTNKEFDFNKMHLGNKPVLLINNAIHPGEPDGVDATMLLLRNLALNKKNKKDVVIAVIPIYNIGGALNRNSTSRANQNGPKEYGFRGNAQNYDLNRDFIKCDSKNALAFTEIFHLVKPDVYIENHVSNGADYQYIITHLFTQHNKLGNNLGRFLHTEMQPSIEGSLSKKGYESTPYVNVWGSTPENGFSQFFDNARYSSGYTSLFNVLGLMIETHMLKPYPERVNATYAMLESTISFVSNNKQKIKKLRANALQEILKNKNYPITYKIDSSLTTTLNFKGYEATMVPSKVTNGKRLYYNRSKPFTKPVTYYNYFKPEKEISIPKGYILKKGWWKVIKLLKQNNVIMYPFKNDTIIDVEINHIKDFKTVSKPYEGHYLHYQTKTSSSNNSIQFSKGDIYIPINQPAARYLMETLESEATDSFFNWNFFDTILQQKEGYSSYVFEDIAEQFLKENPKILESFNQKMKSDSVFAKNPRAQLNYIYKKSPHYESAHLKLPIYKVY